MRGAYCLHMFLVSANRLSANKVALSAIISGIVVLFSSDDENENMTIILSFDTQVIEKQYSGFVRFGIRKNHDIFLEFELQGKITHNGYTCNQRQMEDYLMPGEIII